MSPCNGTLSSSLDDDDGDDDDDDDGSYGLDTSAWVRRVMPYSLGPTVYDIPRLFFTPNSLQTSTKRLKQTCVIHTHKC